VALYALYCICGSEQCADGLIAEPTARDVSNPPAGLQDQHAALDRHRDRFFSFAVGARMSIGRAKIAAPVEDSS